MKNLVVVIDTGLASAGWYFTVSGPGFVARGTAKSQVEAYELAIRRAVRIDADVIEFADKEKPE